jgi:hypothetical protein
MPVGQYQQAAVGIDRGDSCWCCDYVSCVESAWDVDQSLNLPVILVEEIIGRWLFYEALVKKNRACRKDRLCAFLGLT